MRNNTQRKSKRFFSVNEAANYIDRHRSTLDKWRAENIVLPFYQDNKKVLYSIDDLDDYLQSCRVEPVAYGFKPSVADKTLANKLSATTVDSTEFHVLNDGEVSGDA